MLCSSPLPAFLDRNTGEILLKYHPGRDLADTFLPCGHCEHCCRRKAGESALRFQHELHLPVSRRKGPGGEAVWEPLASREGQFLTLTYRDECLPRSDAEWHRHNVLFLKGVRERAERVHGAKLRTLGCRERGDSFGRPHSHFVLVGHAFEVTREWVGVGDSRKPVLRCPELEALWPYGHVGVGELTDESIGYVARYTMKKVGGSSAGVEWIERGRRKVRASWYVLPDGARVLLAVADAVGRSQGLGRGWFDRFGEQAIEQGAVIVRGGARVPLPDYYLKQGRRKFPQVFEETKAARAEAARLAWSENEPGRMAVRCEVAKARHSFRSEGRR